MTRSIGLFLFGLFLCVSGVLEAKDVHVEGSTQTDGMYVAPYVGPSPNSTKNDNYSTKENVNPCTEKEGTKQEDTVAPKSQTESEKKTEPSKESKIPPSGWLGVKSGISYEELIYHMGRPMKIEGNADITVWTYSTGLVFVKGKQVVAWKQNKAQ